MKKFIQLKDSNANSLYPFTDWRVIEGMPNIFKDNETAISLIQVLLTSISGYNASKNQTLKNINGTFQWIDNE